MHQHVGRRASQEVEIVGRSAGPCIRAESCTSLLKTSRRFEQHVQSEICNGASRCDVMTQAFRPCNRTSKPERILVRPVPPRSQLATTQVIRLVCHSASILLCRDKPQPARPQRGVLVSLSTSRHWQALWQKSERLRMNRRRLVSPSVTDQDQVSELVGGIFVRKSRLVRENLKPRGTVLIYP